MELVMGQMVQALGALWWPFCRTLALLSAAPMIGENMVPISVRVLLSLVLAVVLLPVVQAPVGLEPISLAAVVATAEQALIGFALGLAFHLTVAIVMVLGYLIASQMGLAMALMNDPMNGTSSDVVSTLLYILVALVFFSIDGHLVLTGVLGASFQAWPVGGGLAAFVGQPLETLAHAVAWVFSAALLLAVPIVFSAFVVQLGFGFLNRVAPAFNLFSLGFSMVVVFGVFMLAYLVRFIPAHYIRMTERVLEMLTYSMGR